MEDLKQEPSNSERLEASGVTELSVHVQDSPVGPIDEATVANADTMSEGISQAHSMLSAAQQDAYKKDKLQMFISICPVSDDELFFNAYCLPPEETDKSK
ncbi:hypothetical protein LPJ79_004916 [Coemansia sp. RSA 1821]|nr:hypothetical protein LPJ79_004916 [Coemansia sp. RSA 1821]